MDYFIVTEETTVDELRQRYKALSKQHHPDLGGDNAVQAQINTEYQQALMQLARMMEDKGNQITYERILRIMGKHLNSIVHHVRSNKALYYTLLSELKGPIIRKIIPKRYYLLVIGIVKIIEIRISSKKSDH